MLCAQLWAPDYANNLARVGTRIYSCWSGSFALTNYLGETFIEQAVKFTFANSSDKVGTALKHNKAIGLVILELVLAPSLWPVPSSEPWIDIMHHIQLKQLQYT